MKALVTGAAGFVGGHLLAHLRQCGWETAATRLQSETMPYAECPVYELDILDADAVRALLVTVKPDFVFHLAAQSSVARSWTLPALTVDINIKGALNLLEGTLGLSKHPRILLVGSGEEYGYVQPEELPIQEDTLLRPGNIYAGTKIMQGLLGQIYARAYRLEVVMVRAFNHTGPGQSETFVLSDFCRQVAHIEASLSAPVIQVGNLSAQRDFTDVRDIVRAYRLLIEQGESGQTYNVGSGKAVFISDALKMILSLSRVDIKVEQDPARMRPSDTPVIEADISRISALTGWRPEIPMEATLLDMLDYWREKFSGGER